MNLKHLLLTLLMIGFGGKTLVAQCLSNSYRTLKVNKVEARFNNDGVQFWDRVQSPKYIVPSGSGNSPVFTHGLWIGGLSPQGALHMSAATYQQTGYDFYSGPYRNPIAFTCENTIPATGTMPRRGLKRLSNGKILLLDPTNVTVYDPVTKQYIVRPLPQSRGWLDALELADGRIFIFGDETYPTKIPILYMDTVNYNFSVGPQLTWFHKESTATQLHNGKILIAGVVSCEVFDPVLNTSTAVPDMLYPRRNHAAVRLPNGDVQVFGGGQTLTGVGLTYRTQYFDDTLGYWFPGHDLIHARNSPDLVDLLDGTYLITGGTTLTSVCEIFDPVHDTVFASVSLPVSLNANNACLLPNGNVVVATRDDGTNFKGGVFELNLGTQSLVNSICIDGLGPQLVLIDSMEAIAGMDTSTGGLRFFLEEGYQTDHRWQFIWAVSRAEIDQFKADFLANTVDFADYPHIETWPTHGSVQDGEDQHLAPFVDVNMDGLYRPAEDGDYPCIVGDRALWWVLNDQGPHQQTQGLGMGLQVEIMAYAFDCNQTPCADTALDYATFVHYEISNHSDTAWHGMHVGGMYDVDLGGFEDDFIGCDSVLDLGFVYNGDNVDGRYGASPPAWGVAVMPNGQADGLSSFMMFENIFGTPTGVPTRPSDYYNYLKGHWRDSLHLVNNGGDGYPGSAPGPSTNHMYSSTDGFCGGFLSGWSEFTSGNVPFDRTFVVGTGPFDLQPGEQIQYDVCYPYARDSSNTLSVCALESATANIQAWWQNQLDRSCFSIVVKTEDPLPQRGLRVVPNPVGGSSFAVEFGQPLEADAVLELLDMNGRLLRKTALQAGDLRALVEASALPAGVYLVRVVDGAGVISQRVVVW